ncbi:hypothetical protein [Pandoraea sputorum]|uniref:Uncharacterized protein n=1 Tax=Pandoraea sputorum TaxID=93222 RepID=A0A239SE98_9BURK|nr:hypothetical protein [Pandoraea sputorum]BET10737.1 hypothetical protein THI4931_17790 [Pandoraea sputorum]SNU83552.1 Uncharacterised protein [Pandoraea sputorum]VVD97403.1 hypothetical protein PSP20601_01951 [Pandoraea sputorum]VVE77353.1 hypothetical protein PSP31120_01248 [Pandoraea sputorum]
MPAVVKRVTPDVVLMRENVEILIEGSGFDGAEKVVFEDRNFQQFPAKAFRISSDSFIYATTPKLNLEEYKPASLTPIPSREFDYYFVLVHVKGEESKTTTAYRGVPDGDGLKGSMGMSLAEVYTSSNLIQAVASKTDALSEAKKKIYAALAVRDDLALQLKTLRELPGEMTPERHLRLWQLETSLKMAESHLSAYSVLSPE